MPILADIEEILLEANNPKLKSSERQKLLAYAKQQTELFERELRQNSFFEFFRFVRPDFQINWHHRVLADLVQRAESTNNAREICNLPPRTTKSEEISVCGTAWVIGRHPEWKVLQLCLNQKLVEEFGRKTRDLIESEEFKSVFPDVKLHPSSRAVNSFATTAPGSKYLAAGALSNIHGFGGDWIVVDDPIGDQDTTPSAMEKVAEWFSRGPRLRLQPQGRILMVMSRWPGQDLCYRLMDDARTGRGEEWNLTKIPSYTLDDNGKKVWLWPSFWKEDFMELRQKTLPDRIWRSQFQQEDVSDDGSSCIPEDRWRQWKHLADGKEYLPIFVYKIQSWDTAYSGQGLKKNSASACTTWGVFLLDALDKYGEIVPAGGDEYYIMLLDGYKGWIEFPMLKRVAKGLYDRWRPDEVWIEGRASGKPLLQELKKMLGPVLRDYTPVSGETKEVRMAAVTDFWASGRVFVRDLEFHPQLQEVVSACARGPGDLTDTVSQALRRFRRGGFVTSSLDDSFAYEKKPRRKIRRVAVYG
ncbi:MAG: hypothetical protein WAN65_13385 [Candidatus Sulfotelmatobacter sp.]